MGKVLYFSVVVCLFPFLVMAQQNQNVADKIVGVYWSPKKDAKIEIFKSGGKYFGKFIWASIARKDTKNPSRALRQRELLGVVFLTNFSYSKGTYKEGEVYDPESGKTYDCVMSLVGNDLKVRGYWGLSQFGRTEVFERVL